MLKIRAIREEDFERIAELAAQHNYDIQFNNTLANIVIENELEEVVGFAQLRSFVEAVFLPDHSFDKRVIVDMTKLVLNEAKELKVDIHAFVENDNFTEILKKHFDFHPCVGNAIIKIHKEG